MPGSRHEGPMRNVPLGDGVPSARIASRGSHHRPRVTGSARISSWGLGGCITDVEEMLLALGRRPEAWLRRIAASGKALRRIAAVVGHQWLGCTPQAQLS